MNKMLRKIFQKLRKKGKKVELKKGYCADCDFYDNDDNYCYFWEDYRDPGPGCSQYQD